MTKTEPVSEMLCRYFLYVFWFVCHCVLCVLFQVCLFCIDNLAPLHVMICEWFCYLLPVVFFLASGVYVCVCPGLCAIVLCVSQVCSVLVFWPTLRVVNCEWLSLIATCVSLASSIYVCVCPGRSLCGL
jgi:hypothetical protein